jgi:hypothetical protein
MRPKTSVRPPIIAAAQRRHLSQLLRNWRRQPRQRSRLLFALLLTVAVMSDIGILFIGIHLYGAKKSTLAPPAERGILVPYAEDTELWQSLRTSAVRVGGRIRSFESFCREAVAAITGGEGFEERDPVAVVVSWMLDAGADSLGWNEYPFLRCDDAELRAVLYGAESNRSRMTREEQLHGRFVEPTIVQSCRAFQKILQRAETKEARRSPLEQKAVALRERLSRWQRIRAGEVEDGGGAEMWTVSAELRQAYQSGDKELFAAALNDYLEASRRVLNLEHDTAAQRRLSAEAWLNARAPTRKALAMSVLATACLILAALVKTRRPVWHRLLFRGGVFAALACLAWATAALVAHSIQDGALVGDGSQGLFFCSAATMGLGFLLALLHRETICARCAAAASSIGFLLADRGVSWPRGIDGDVGSRLQLLLFLSAFAALTLAWSIGLLAAVRVLLAAPNNERLRRLAAVCLSALRVGMVLWVGSILVEGLRTCVLHDAWRGWNGQTLGTLVLLPVCFALLYARRRGWMQPFAVVMSVVVVFSLAVLLGYVADRVESWGQLRAADAWLYGVGLVSFSLAAHAALRYNFGRQRVFDV